MAATEILKPSEEDWAKKRTPRVLVAKLGIDVHDRGALTVARELRDLGMEVVYIGNALPGQIIKAAIEEGVHVVGVSSLGGAHLNLGARLLEVAGQQGLQHSMVFLIGGVFPPRDIPELRKFGFDGVFGPGTTGKEVASCIREVAASKFGIKF